MIDAVDRARRDLTKPAGFQPWPGNQADYARAGLLALTVLLIYNPALLGSPLFDDDEHITKPALRSVKGLQRIWLEPGATQQYYPLLHTAFWIQFRLWGEAVLGYHLVNVAWHTLTALGLVRIVRQLRLPGAWIAGFLFAVHPVAVESVAWIAEQKNTLSALFYVAAASAYLSFDDTRRRRHYLLASGLFGLALLSKTSVVVLVPVLLIVVGWRRGSLTFRRDLVPLVPWGLAALAMGLVTIHVENQLIAEAGVDAQLSPLLAVLVASRALWFYLGKLFWPAGLNFMYPRWAVHPEEWSHYVPLVGLLVVGLGLACLGARARAAGVGLAVFVVCLGPFLGFFAVEWFAFGYVADHFQYLAMMGIFVPVAAGLAQVQQRLDPRWAKLVGWGMVVGIALLAGLAYRQSGYYRDAETRYRATIALNPAACVAHNNLGKILLHRPGGLPEALHLFQRAVELRPGFVEAHNNLGNAYVATGQLGKAVGEYEFALAGDPTRAAVHANLAHTLAKLPSRQSDAIAHYRQALRLDPSLAQAHAGLGAALLHQREFNEEAISHLEMAIRLNPQLPDAYTNLGNALLVQAGQETRAIRMYEQALALAPGVAEIHYNLALALLRNRQTDAGVRHLQAAASLAPTWELPRQILQQLPGSD
jgi:protein O-mannosyl-transferase